MLESWGPKHYQDFETHPSLIKDFKIVSALLFPLIVRYNFSAGGGAKEIVP